MSIYTKGKTGQNEPSIIARSLPEKNTKIEQWSYEELLAPFLPVLSQPLRYDHSP